MNLPEPDTAPHPDDSRAPGAVTFLFTDVEGSTRLWETEPQRMRPAMARHDVIVRASVDSNGGTVVKMTGDGIHAAFGQPLAALLAALEIQLALAAVGNPDATPLAVRCGLHSGNDERRDNDYFGPAVNRAARIMSAAHGGQLLLSQAVAERVAGQLPAGVQLRDLGSVRLRDLATPERIYQLAHPQLRDRFPPLRSLASTPNNLAQQLNSFIGRERELAQTRQMLATSRMLTLLGMGGIGKSRLSLQLAAEVLDDFADGVWFIELAPLTDERSVPQALASIIGVKEEAGRPVLEAVLKYVRDKQLLIVLDNCEHVLHACADLAKQLLQAGAGVKVLTSSRDYLQIAGETTFHVPTLSAPDPHRKEPLAALAEHEAVRLFIDRVTAARPEFALTESNAAAVTDICHRLDGIPLALELAAARARALSVENIAARLSDRFKLLVTGDRTVLPRQRTLRALIDWSYDLLDERERAVFQRLSVFAGGWTLAAAESVCAGGVHENADLLDLQSQLVEKSLVVMDAGGERYRLLDTVRAYALEKLHDGGDEAETRSRHLAYYLALAEAARPELHGARQAEWLDRLDRERENLMSANAWCDNAQGGAGLGFRLLYAIKTYCLYRGLLGLGYRVSVEAVKRPGAQTRDVARCRGLCDAGQLCSFTGRYAEALGYLEESLAIAREIDDKARIAVVLQPLGMAFVGLGDLARARACSEEAVALAREQGKPREIAAALIALAQLHRIEGQLDLAAPLYENAVSIAREHGDRMSMAIGLLNLAMVSLGQGAVQSARPMLLQALGVAVDNGVQAIGQSVIEVTSALCAKCGALEQAARFFGAAEAQAERAGLRRDAVDEAFLAPIIARVGQTLGALALDAAQSEGRALTYDEALTQAREWIESGARVIAGQSFIT